MSVHPERSEASFDRIMLSLPKHKLRVSGTMGALPGPAGAANVFAKGSVEWQF